MPLLLFRKVPRSKPITASLTELGLCNSHKETALVLHFLSNEGWTKVEKHLRENGFQGYKQGLTELEWKLRPEVPTFNEYEGSAF